MSHLLTALQNGEMLTVRDMEKQNTALSGFADKVFSVPVSPINWGTVSSRYLNQITVGHR